MTQQHFPDLRVWCAACDCTDIPTTDAPVCGTDHNTYGNDCIAQCANIVIVSDGACPNCKIQTNSASLTEERGDRDSALPRLNFRMSWLPCCIRSNTMPMMLHSLMSVLCSVANS